MEQLPRFESPSAALAPQPLSPIDPSPLSPLGPSVLIPAYIAVILIGYLLFHTSGVATATGNELSRQRALFASVNAATLTGFAQSTNVNDYTAAGQATACGLIVAGTLFSLIAGGTAVCRLAKLPYSDRQIALASVVSVATAAIIGGVTLHGGDRGFIGGAFDGISAFANSGLFLRALPSGSSAPTVLVLLPLAVLGGLGMPVIMELLARLRSGRSLSAHFVRVITSSCVVFLIGTVLLMAVDAPSLFLPDSLWHFTSPVTWQHAVVSAGQLSLNARSAGFPFTFATEWSRGVQWTVMLLMLIGGASGGAAGGLKLNTVGLLIEPAIWPWRSNPITGPVLSVALRWVLIYGVLIGITLIALLASEPQIPGDRVLFLAISGIGNVGLSHDPVVLSDAGWWIMSASMLIGRLAPVLMLWWMVDTAPGECTPIG